MLDSDLLQQDSVFNAVMPEQVNKPNVIQNLLLSPVKNGYFPWLCLLLLVSSDNLRRPLIYFAIVHWAINAIGDVFYQSVFLYKPDYPTFPFSNFGYTVSIGIASVLYLVSEILGDWYLLLRTKVLIRNNKKGLAALFISCIVFNLMKVAEIIVYIRYVPFPTGVDDINAVQAEYGRRFNIVIEQRLKVLIFQQIASFIYDILVIFILKRNVFVKQDSGLSQNTFLSKFKQLSEYRIYFGVLLAVVVSPFIFVEIILISQKSQQEYYNVIYVIRSKLLNFFYVFMYIDQISLRFFVERTNVVRSSYKVSNNSTNSNHNITYFNKSNNNNNSNPLPYNKSSTSLSSLTYNKSNGSLSSLNYNSQVTLNNYNNNNNGSNFSLSNPNNYRYNNYNIVNSFNGNANNNNSNNIFHSDSNNSISDIFYNNLVYQNQIDYEDNKFLINKKYMQQKNN